MSLIGNVIVPLITPERRADFFPLIDHILAGGVEDLVLFGTTGEGALIKEEEKKALIHEIVPFIKGRARLYVGLMSQEVKSNADLANFCHELGFTAALFPTQAYRGEASLLSQFLGMTEANIFLYNSPKANYKEKDRVIPFIEKGRVIGLKDSSGDLTLFQEILASFRSDFFKVFYGREYQLEKVLELPIDGFFTAAANIEPSLMMKLWEHREEDLFDQFKLLKKQILEANPENYIEAIKRILKERFILESD